MISISPSVTGAKNIALGILLRRWSIGDFLVLGIDLSILPPTFTK